MLHHNYVTMENLITTSLQNTPGFKRQGEETMCLRKKGRVVKRSIIVGSLAFLLFIGAFSSSFALDLANLYLSGDFRLRYRYSDIDEYSRHRGAFRLRINASMLLHNTVQFAFGLGSGQQSGRSTMQTFTDYFSSKPLWIDHAYITWTPVDKLSIYGGKMKNPLFNPAEYLWDTDLRLEGFALNAQLYTYPVDGFFVSGIFWVEEFSTEADPMMFPFQVGGSVSITPEIVLEMAATYYLFTNLDQIDVTDPDYDSYSAGTNSRTGTQLTYDYDCLEVNGELFFSNVWGPYIPTASLIGEFVYNFNPSTENLGYLGGVKFGHLDVFNFKEWNAMYGFFHLERDAWLDIFPSTTILEGATNVAGHVIVVNFGIAKQTWVRLHLDFAHELVGSNKQNLFQADVNFRF